MSSKVEEELRTGLDTGDRTSLTGRKLTTMVLDRDTQ